MPSNIDGDMVLGADGAWITKREAEALGLIVQGQGSDEISNALYLSDSMDDSPTVEVDPNLNVADGVSDLPSAESTGVHTSEPASESDRDWRDDLEELLISSHSGKVSASLDQSAPMAPRRHQTERPF